MSKKIIVIGDIITHSEEHIYKNTVWVQKVFLPIIKDCVSPDVMVSEEISNYTEVFDRNIFFKLGGIDNPQQSYQDVDFKKLNQKQKDYLSKFFTKDTIVIGFELYELCELLTEFECNVIDLALHSYKLFDDLAFCLFTNNKNIYNQLLKYQVPKEKFYYYANYWKCFMQMNNMIPDKDIENNSVIFIGQTLKDKSVKQDSKYLNVTHFEDRLKEFFQQYSKVYYVPHPYLGKYRKLIYDFVKKSPYIELLKNCSTYGLLASDKVKKVTGISTSVLYEAQYFNKEVEYLYKPLFNIDDTFENKGYISIYEDYWNPKFWADILSPVCKVKQDVPSINHFKGSNNKLRNIKNSYWGYKDLDPIKRIPNFEESVRQIYIKYIAQMF